MILEGPNFELDHELVGSFSHVRASKAAFDIGLKALACWHFAVAG